jgi:quercetin dioxygenase-like cupin family protein
VLREGDTLYFPPDTWHWGYNFGPETCRILESLTPRTEAAVEAYAVRQPWLKDIRYGPREAIGAFAPGGERGAQRAKLVSPGDYLYEIVGEERPMRVGLVCSTDMLTTAIVDLHPGQESEPVTHPGDKVLYCLAGRMNVHLPTETPNWWELNPGDAAFIPAGCGHSFHNTSDGMAKFLFSVAPTYR